MQKLRDYYVLFICGGATTGAALSAAYVAVGGERDPLRILVYSLIAGAVLVLAAGHTVLLAREHNGKAPFWLVSITWALIVFSLTLLDVVALICIQIFYPTVFELFEFPTRMFYGFLGAAAVALSCAAFAFTYGMYTRTMRREVWATPYHALKYLVSKLLTKRVRVR